MGPARARSLLLGLALASASLVGCHEIPYPGWKVTRPNELPRSCREGGFAVEDRDGMLRIITEPWFGATVGFTSAVAHRDGWLLTQFGCEGELCRGASMHVLAGDGAVTKLELDRRYDAAASGPDGLYLLDKSCNFHRTYSAQTTLYRTPDLEHEPVLVGGPWPDLCARAIAVDDSGSIWLIGSVYDPFYAELDDVLLRVVDGQPRVVHQIRHRSADDSVRQTHTQMAIVDGAIYLSDPSTENPMVRVRQTEQGVVEERLVGSKCRLERHQPRVDEDPLGYQDEMRLQSAGVVLDGDRSDSITILPYHAPLDAIVDLLIELVPADGTYTILVVADREPSLEPLQRLPAGFAIADHHSEATTAELHRRFPHLNPTNSSTVPTP